tara:strand:- start:346 stop:1191 length:846 start_codon:yes stop_codon:yes gene_type:complete
MLKINFVQDFFRKDLLGGAESNDVVLISFLSEKYTVSKVYSHALTEEFLDANKDDLLIFSNFTMASQIVIDYVTKNCKYIIYEHDHKYVNTRDPSKFEHYTIPEECIINREFYENAKSIVVLSRICKEILERNLNINNVYNIGCSLWSDKKFDFIESICNIPKTKKYAILNSKNPVKGKDSAIAYCTQNKISYELIGSDQEEEFLKQLSQYEVLVFIPQVLETFCRLAGEAKMLNCDLVTRPNLLGMYSEECSKLKGSDLITDLRKRRDEALFLFERLIKQ